MRRIVIVSALLAALLLAACAKPWSHPNYSGREADVRFKEDSLKCEVVAGEEFPLDKHKQNKRYLMCMADLGWNYHPDGQGITFQTKPR